MSDKEKLQLFINWVASEQQYEEYQRIDGIAQVRHPEILCLAVVSIEEDQRRHKAFKLAHERNNEKEELAKLNRTGVVITKSGELSTSLRHMKLKEGESPFNYISITLKDKDNAKS